MGPVYSLELEEEEAMGRKATARPIRVEDIFLNPELSSNEQ